MSDYSDYKMIEQKLRDGMVQGMMHACLRDVGSIAGGCLAAKRITQEECDALGALAESLAINKREAQRKWKEGVEYGLKKPLPHDSAPIQHEAGRAIGWDEEIDLDNYRIIDAKWLEKEVIETPSSDWNPCAQLREYLSLLFSKDEHVAFCTDPYKKDGRYIPTRGTCSKTAGEIIKSLQKNDMTGFSEAVGTVNTECGAWIVINPCDGTGRKDENITDFRYALVESDEKPIDEQVAIYRKLELPCVCIVHSGGKSAHAIVRVNASDIQEYRKRVDFLYKVCSDNGLPVDKQNRNPSRYSRMPGVVRGENKQFIIDRNCGKESWEEWEDWIKEQNDDLPDFEPMTDEEFKNPPKMRPELIEGILRTGHKMIVVGPSKAGKSFLLIELAIAIAEGTEWIGHKCMQGKVLYVNLEIDKESFTNRIIDVYNEMEIERKNERNFVRWPLRGHAMPLDKLVPRLVRRAKGENYLAVIIDPIYKVMTGDESSSEDIGIFTNCIDRILRELDCSVIYCHHHSKGGQGDKRSMDRASGSGVFARDTDAMIDMLPLEAANAKEQFMQSYECAAMAKAADENEDEYAQFSWRTKVSEDDKLVPNRLSGALEQILGDGDAMDKIRAAREAVKKEFDSVTGWRISFTLRDFATPACQEIWFKHPLHMFDNDNLLKECTPEGETSRGGWKGRPKKQKENRVPKFAEFKQIVEFDPNEKWTISKAAERMNVGVRTIRRYLSDLGWTTDKNIIVVKKSNDEKDEIPF